MRQEQASTSQRNAQMVLLLSLLSLSVPLVGRSLFADALGTEAGLLIWILALVPPFLLSYQHGWRGASVALAAGMAAFAFSEAALLLLGRAPPPPEIVFGSVVILIVVALGAGALAELYRDSLRRAREEALTDPLTRVPNRRAAHLYLEKAFDAARRGGTLTVVLFDLDHFKAVNDTYGHAAGDEVLRAFASVVSSMTRTMNLSARYGGEEFISVLAAGDAAGAMVFCERVRERLAATELPVPGVTVSAGVAEYEEGMATPEVLVAAADQALYRAKANGRDRVEVLERQGRRAEPAPQPAPPREVDPHLQGGGERVLVVDDDESARSGMARALRRFGYSVLEAGSPRRALQIARGSEEPLDLVVTDIVMPDIHGFRFIEMLQAFHPPVRVVYTSGYSQEEVEWAGVPGSASAFLAKPVDIEDLAATVGGLLRSEADAAAPAAASATSAASTASAPAAGPPLPRRASPPAARPVREGPGPALAACDEAVLEASVVVAAEAHDRGELLAGVLRDAGFRNVRTLREGDRPRLSGADLLVADVPGRHALTDLVEPAGPTEAPSLLLLAGDGPEGRTAGPPHPGPADLLQRAVQPSELVEVLQRPVQPPELVRATRGLLRARVLALQLASERERFQDALAASRAELQDSRSDLMRRLARAAEFRDDTTGDHAERVGRMAALVAAELGWEPARVGTIQDAAILHDAGKIAIPDAILLKPGPLTPAEREVMRRHTLLGSALLSGSRFPTLVMAAEIALTHHERWDGSGYPAGLAGEEIPMAGRIVAVVDAYDSQVHRRPYRRPVDPDRAVRELVRESGKQFDPAVVDAFLALRTSGRLDEALGRQLVAWPDVDAPPAAGSDT